MADRLCKVISPIGHSALLFRCRCNEVRMSIHHRCGRKGVVCPYELPELRWIKQRCAATKTSLQAAGFPCALRFEKYADCATWAPSAYRFIAVNSGRNDTSVCQTSASWSSTARNDSLKVKPEFASLIEFGMRALIPGKTIMLANPGAALRKTLEPGLWRIKPSAALRNKDSAE